jgi:hypothetical protein
MAFGHLSVSINALPDILTSLINQTILKLMIGMAHC